MPFRALIDGKRVISLHIESDAWRALATDVRTSKKNVQMACCGAKGILKISPLGRQFFAHGTQPKECDWKPESPEHVELKAVVHDAVQSVYGWKADIECSGPDWRADVLAIRGKARIAFEIQLSAQGQAVTSVRENRYEASSVLPWWIVTPKNNAGTGFGSNLRSVIQGEEFTQLAASATKAVHELLQRVESQVRISEVIATHLQKSGIKYRLRKFCNLPVAFVVDLSTINQQSKRVVVVGELGSDSIPNLEDLYKSAPSSSWGSVAQFVRYSPQIRGFGATAFSIKRDPATEIPPILNDLISNKLVWRGQQHDDHVEAALVWYREICRSCGEPFARAPFVVSGHLRHWSNYQPRLVQFSVDQEKPWTQEVVRIFEKRENLRLGTFWHAGHRDTNSIAIQNCPHCGDSNTRSLVSAEQALKFWPYDVVDWKFGIPLKKKGWQKPAEPLRRLLPPISIWIQTLKDARDERERAEQEERRLEEERERKLAEWHETIKQRRAEEATKAEVLRIETERRREQARIRRLAEDTAEREAVRLAHAMRAQEQLLSLAVSKFGRKDLADLWMRAHEPRLKGRPIDVCIKHFEKCANLLNLHKRR